MANFIWFSDTISSSKSETASRWKIWICKYLVTFFMRWNTNNKVWFFFTVDWSQSRSTAKGLQWIELYSGLCYYKRYLSFKYNFEAEYYIRFYIKHFHALKKTMSIVFVYVLVWVTDAKNRWKSCPINHRILNIFFCFVNVKENNIIMLNGENSYHL